MSLPLDEGAAVCGFEAVVDGTLVVGEVRNARRRSRPTTMRWRMDMAPSSWTRKGPMYSGERREPAAGKEVLVRLTYVTELSVDGGHARFTIPTTVSPRYAPAQDRAGVGRSDAQTLNPSVEWRVPYGLDLALRVTMPGRITGLESPSHPISVTSMKTSDREARAGADGARPRLRAVHTRGRADAPQAVIERAEDGTEAIAVSFVPAFSETASPAEIILWSIVPVRCRAHRSTKSETHCSCVCAP